MTVTTRLSVDLWRLLWHGPKDAHLLVATPGWTEDSLLTGHAGPGGPREARCRGCGCVLSAPRPCSSALGTGVSSSQQPAGT